MRPSNVPDEQSLVPYEASAFVGKRVVVFAPHPDDEVLGCGGALADLIDRGAGVDVVLVTDGAAGAKGPEDRARIASLRLEESRRALDALGGGRLHAGDAVARALEGATVAFFELSQPFRPNFLFDATRVLARKERAMAVFASQAAVRDYAGFVRGLNVYRRMTLSADVVSAEAYSVAAGFRLRNDPEGVVRALLPVAIEPGR